MSDRTHKARMEALRKSGGSGYAKARPTHPLRQARRDAAAYRLGNPDTPGGRLDVHMNGRRVEVIHADPDRYARAHRTVKVFAG